MFRNNNHKVLQFSGIFILLFMLVACNAKTDNKKNQSKQNNTSMNMDMPNMNMDMSNMPMDSSSSDTLNFVLKPTNEYVRSGVPLAALQRSEEEIEVDALGKVVYDTRQIGSISARISGRIEKLYVRFRYQKISAGQKIMDIYSPEILTAEENLLFLLKNDQSNISLINASKQKLLLLGMSEDQLNKIILTQKPDFTISVYSKYSGHIHEAGAMMGNAEQPAPGAMRDISLITEELSLKEGMYVQKGQTILSVYNPNHAWAILNFYGDKQAIIHTGSPVRIVPETAPAKDFRARVNFIEPFYRKENKTVTARVYFDNSNLQIPIGSQVRATIFGNTESANWLPETAVVSLGLDKVVFIKHDIGFKAHKVLTGITYKNKIQVLQGLTAKDTVAANAQYLMDSESFIKVNE